jgi:hypothetical protein
MNSRIEISQPGTKLSPVGTLLAQVLEQRRESVGNHRLGCLEAVGHGGDVAPNLDEGPGRKQVGQVGPEGDDPPRLGEVLAGYEPRLPGPHVDALGEQDSGYGRSDLRLGLGAAGQRTQRPLPVTISGRSPLMIRT